MENVFEKYMKIALGEAEKAKRKDEVPVGVVVVLNNKIIAKAHNTRESKQIITGHAEMVAISKLNKKYKTWRFPEADIYITLEPCIMCAGAIFQSRFKRIIYGAKDFKGGALGSSIDISKAKDINTHPEIIGGILEKQCSDVIKEYFKEKRKNKELFK